MSKVIDDIIAKAQNNVKTIVLAEGEEPRTVAASQVIAAKGIAKLILLGDEAKIKDMYPNFKSKGISIVNPLAKDNEDYINEYYELRKSKGMTLEQAKLAMKNPLFYGAMMVRKGLADGMVAGAINATGNVLRAGLQIIKTAPGIRTVSSCFIMCLDETHMKDRHVMVFGDSAVNIAPTAEQLADIAIASAATAKVMAGIEPRIAMLSFSTKGSAKHEAVDKVVAATNYVKYARPDLMIDGELQVDAAIIPSVARLKERVDLRETACDILCRRAVLRDLGKHIAGLDPLASLLDDHVSAAGDLVEVLLSGICADRRSSHSLTRFSSSIKSFCKTNAA